MARMVMGRQMYSDPVDSLCCTPWCESSADPDLPVPMCTTCGRKVALAWMSSKQHTLQAEAGPSLDPVFTDAEHEAMANPQGFVYFARFSDRIKIGFTTNLNRRMLEVPHDELLGSVSGTTRDEARCHTAFASTRITGEWFEDTEELRSFILDVSQ